MTRQEAIEKLKRERNGVCHGCVHPSMVGWCENHCKLPEAYDMAIEALWQPEIIRCKDCKEFRRWIDTDIEFCDKTGNKVSEIDFCSMAERRTDE